MTTPVAPTEPVQPIAPVQPAAPVQPVAPAAPVAPVEPAAPTPQPQGIKGFTPTGDAGIDLALDFFSKHGLTEQSPEIAEAAKGNFQYLEAKLASLGDKAKGWEQYLALAKGGYESVTKAEQAALEARQKTVFDAVGGEENWNNIQTWATENAEPGELAAIKQTIKLGGIAATAMAVYLQSQYASASGTTLEPASATTANPNPPMQGAPLTRQGFRQELAALQAKIGAHAMDSSPEYAALRQKYAAVVR